jgi:hypothetical protein
MIFPDANLLAIDPGKSGGLAWFDAREQSVQARKMPETERDVIELVAEIQSASPIAMAALEKVGGFAGQGQPGSAMFRFGENYGLLKAALMAHRVPFELVTPQKWQKTFQLGRKADHATPSRWKAHLKGRAQMLFPDLKLTNATADAALILAWLARQYQPKEAR